MFRASSYVASGEEPKECLFCGNPVKIGWVKSYRNTKVWICERCVRGGEFGAVIATSIFDEISQKEFDRPSDFRGSLFRKIDGVVDATRLRVYQDVLNYILYSIDFKGLSEKTPEKREIEKPFGEKSEGECGVLTEEIEETDGLEGKIISDEDLETKFGQDEGEGNVEGSCLSSEGEWKEDYKIPEVRYDERKTAESLEEREEKIPVSNTLPRKEEILQYLEDWKSALDIKRAFNAKYMPLLDLLDEMHERGYLLKREDEDKTGGRKYEYKKATGMIYPKKKAEEVARLWD